MPRFGNGFRWYGLQVVPINFCLIIGELVLVGFGVRQIHDEKTRQDAIEPYDSAYISQMVLIFSCLILTVCIVAVLVEFTANILLYIVIRDERKGKVKAYYILTIIITVLSSIGLILFYLTNAMALFYTNSQVTKMIILGFWTFRILYTILTNILVFKILTYMTYNIVQPSSVHDDSL